jgi:hypothetical protein
VINEVKYLPDVCANLFSVNKAIKNGFALSNDGESAYCTYCHRPGHHKGNCFKLKNRSNRNSGTGNGDNQYWKYPSRLSQLALVYLGYPIGILKISSTKQ